MKNLIYALAIVSVGVFTSIAHASFKEQRDTVGKSSYTESTDINVKLSSGPSFVRSIAFSGAAPTTITNYNCQEYSPTKSTRTKVYWPGGQITPMTVDVDVINSTGTMYHKIGTAHATFNWDWYTKPSYVSPLNEGN